MLLAKATPDFANSVPLQWTPAGAEPVRTKMLCAEDTVEILAFLATRPLHTVFMAGLIRENGLVSPHNRGKFYACRDRRTGAVEGVALVGHATLVEARTERALKAFARLARETSDSTHMIMGERERVAHFWQSYSEAGPQMRLACRELLFELKEENITPGAEPVHGLRLATLDDLDLIAPAQAEMAFQESGVNPLAHDPEGFRRRCARRIELGRTWVLIEDGRLIFKAEVQSETPEVVYLEGIYVSAAARGRGDGRRCLSQLCRTLFARGHGSVCLLVNDENTIAHAFYRKIGFTLQSTYDTIFLHRREH
ncbi:MAG: GNAT family N-acetyltransferase [Pyrinomonadaceae bacterium]